MDRRNVENLSTYLFEQFEAYPFEGCVKGFASSDRMTRYHPQEGDRGHFAVLSVKGLKSTRRIMDTLLARFGDISAIPFPDAGALALIRYPVNRADQWYLQISGSPLDTGSVEAPPKVADWWSESIELDELDREFIDEETEPASEGAALVTEVFSHVTSKDCLSGVEGSFFTLKPQSPTKGHFCVLHGFTSLRHAAKAAKEASNAMLSLNFIALHNLKLTREAERLGWLGNFALMLGQLRFGNIGS